MQNEQIALRNFKGGSWDLRKNDRRKESQSIGFPERRSTERRNLRRMASTGGETLQWLTKSGLDE